MRSVKNRGDNPLLFFDADFRSPAENLACDEALLDLCDFSDGPGFVRFWESPEYFVVLGYGKQLESEVFRESCEDLRIPIFRRCSGGGTVLQGPGSFNYTLVLPIERAPELATISGANCYIMQRNLAVLRRVTEAPVEIQGYTDLVVNGRKFSGNAQRRKRRALLFHGALLLDLDLAVITQTLRLPAQQPEYRSGRSHADFLTTMPMDRAAMREAFIEEWNATESVGAVTPEIERLMGILVKQKYSNREWNERS